MNAALSNPQKRLLCDIARWGEIGPDAEDAAGCAGGAFQNVVRALQRKGFIALQTDNACSWMAVTDTGKAALAEAKKGQSQ